MNKKVLKTVEFHKIIDMLCVYASSEKGKELCRSLTPYSSMEEIADAQQQTSDALSRIFKRGSCSFQGICDITSAVRHLEIGGTLLAGELLRIADLLQAAKRARAYDRDSSDDTHPDSLSPLFSALEPLSPLAQEITRCILAEDVFADDATPGLKHVRRQINVTNERIHSQLNQMLNSSSIRSCLQDALITMRGGRYCLPVKAEYKSSVSGMIHDQSSTGSTIFIEPAAVVSLNNQLRELQLQEQEEIEMLLATLSNLAAEHTAALLSNFSLLARLDFIFAKGLLAMEMNGVAPVFNSNGVIRLRSARHPLLDKKRVVPIDLTLGDAFDLLIITGPNTGGKTVSLKTCGLLTLMGQAGLHIPAADRSELSFFDEVFADIGDEQSIEQSLSTFSSHMTNIIRTLTHLDKHPEKRFLVLFDELCAGTDPAEGAALAISILSRLHNLGIRTIATTHYSELKVFALSTPGVENACCEFSIESLSPTYHLLIGVPGKSNAFAISKKLGLSADLISFAQEQINEEDRSFEDVLIELEQKRVAMERDRLQLDKDRREVASLKEQLTAQEERLASSRDKLLRNANEEAAEILRRAKQVADETIRDFNKYAKSNPKISEMEEKRSKIGRELNKHQKKSSDIVRQQPVGHKAPRNLRVGDPVKILSMNMKGTVYSLPNAKGDLQVQMGIMRSKVNISDLILLEDDDTAAVAGRKKVSKSSYHGLGKAATISPEINLLGMNSDEAVAALDKYLDDAYLSHLKSVRVVHGKGTGALRKAVHQYLRRQKNVADYHLAEFGEGDAGVTIVTFQ